MRSATPLDDALLLEAVRCVEESGPLDDSEALHAASLAASDDAGRLIVRARILGERLGLPTAIARARHAAPWVLAGLAVLVVLAGAGLAGKVVGAEDGSRRINAVAALGSLLGLHLVTLLIWLVGLVWTPGAWRLSLGGLWLGLSARFASGRQGQAPLLLQAITRLLNRARLLPWALGLASHVVWTLSFTVALGSLLFALAFRRYTLGWETTILEPGFFVRLVQGLGYLPSLMGFPVPSASAILSAASGAAPIDAAGQRDWALWMTGCLALYGWLPRALLALLCVAMLRMRRAALLQPDLEAPRYRRILQRISALVPATRIVDADPGRSSSTQPPTSLPIGATSATRIAIGFELAPQLIWPPSDWPSDLPNQMCDGSATSRTHVLAQLAGAPPRRVLLVCDAAASPDRGTERFVRELLQRSGGVDLLLRVATSAPDSSNDFARRWRDWIDTTGLPMPLVTNAVEWDLAEQAADKNVP